MEIELLTTSALLKELSTRFDHYVFAGIKTHDENSNTEVRRHGGSWRMCQGLAVGLITDLEQGRQAEITPVDDEDI